jgi:pimeloyl-ACP methyl ester carboxylesterase
MLQSFAGGSIFGSATGVGPPRVIALHGWGRTHADFNAVLAPSDGEPLDALALDLPGFGATPPPPSPWGSADYARALLPVLEEIGGPVVLVGHSHGGRVALCLADMVPGSVGGLVLIGAPVLRPPSKRPSTSYRVIRWLNRIGLYSDARLEALRRQRGSADYRAASGVMRDTLVTVVNETFEDELGRLSMPTTFLWGAQDTDVPLWIAEEGSTLAGQGATRPRVVLEVLPDVGHLVPTGAPAATRRAIEELL